MKNLIQKILKEETNKKVLKGVEDSILKNSYLEVVDEKWVRPKYDELLYGIRRPKYDQYFKDNYNITNLQDMFEIERNVKERMSKMEKNYGFAFEHRLPYFEYPLSLYDLEKEIKKQPNKGPKHILDESNVEPTLNVGDKVTIIANKKIGPMRWDRYKVPYVGVTFQKDKVIDTDATYLGECNYEGILVLSQGHERCFEPNEINIIKNTNPE